jgi:septum formation protein
VSQKIVLASASASRRAMLTAAGVPYEAVRPSVDEDSAKASLRAMTFGARQLADARQASRSCRCGRSAA